MSLSVKTSYHVTASSDKGRKIARFSMTFDERNHAVEYYTSLAGLILRANNGTEPDLLMYVQIKYLTLEMRKTYGEGEGQGAAPQVPSGSTGTHSD